MAFRTGLSVGNTAHLVNIQLKLKEFPSWWPFVITAKIPLAPLMWSDYLEVTKAA